MPMIEARDGTRLYAKSWGEGPPVVLIHGWPLSGDSWDPIAHGLRPTLLAAQAFATTDFRPDLKHFTVPTLIIHGTADKTVPIDATAREVARALPHAQLVEYDGEPHGVFATAPDRLREDLIAFLEDRPLDDQQEEIDLVTAQSLVTNPI